ncbi:hypothetical protein MJO28_017038 [Puccinia striiformis f. sp. tritici]|nr:hypothetical protein MJO28_017038 [Puccinia striiformis f. sp. tritici]
MRSELVIGKPKDRRAQLIQRVLNKPDKRRASPQPLNEPKLNFCHLYYQHKLSPGPRNSAFTSSNQSSRMQDLIFLNSAHFFENNCDVLAFKGTFASESGPHLRARPNASPLALYRLRADRQCLQDNESYPIGLNLSLPYHGGFEVAAGRSYRLQGTIGKLDDETTTVLEIEQDGDNQEIADTELVELGPVTITGIGAIERATLLYSIPLELPVWELIVAHEGMVRRGIHRAISTDFDSRETAAQRSRCDTCWASTHWTSRATQFLVDSRIFLTGELDSLGNKSGMMIVNVSQLFTIIIGVELTSSQVTGGMYFETF